MDWILDNIRLIVIVGGGIAYWLNQRRKAKEDEQAARTIVPSPSKVPLGDEAERTRRIQEEIRRKILERMGGGARQQPPTMPKVEVSLPLASPPTKTDAYAEQSVSADRAMLERQQQLAAKLRELDAQRREPASRAEMFAETVTVAMSASTTAVRGSLLADLRNPTSARRAMVLREVLGTPVGLR